MAPFPISPSRQCEVEVATRPGTRSIALPPGFSVRVWDWREACETNDLPRHLTATTLDSILDFYTNAPLLELGLEADRIRNARHPAGVVTYIVDRNINYTNVCVADCGFCAF